MRSDAYAMVKVITTIYWALTSYSLTYGYQSTNAIYIPNFTALRPIG
jgi:hypothetical protein